MDTKSQRTLMQLSLVLVVVVVAAVGVGIWKATVVAEVFFSDPKPIILNGLIVLLFALGVGQLLRGLTHYALEEREITRFLDLRADGASLEMIFDDPEDDSLIARRYFTIRELFARGVTIDHGAIAAVSLAEESLYQSFPRFVNNVLILTGVFGTVSSLIFALLGASTVLQNALPGEGMGLMLLGMNTALTTTATAIVCYFLFTYFYQKLTDVQTYLFSRIEQAVLLHIVPEFVFESEAVNHETRSLINEVRALVREMQAGLGDVALTLTGLNTHNDEQLRKWSASLAGQEEHNRKLHEALARLDDLRAVLVEGFRLK